VKKALFATAVGVVICGVFTYAHHSFSATYDENATPVMIEGELVQLQFRSPHSFVHVMAPDPTGTMQRWAVEWAQGSQLARSGVTRETLRPGDRVVVTGSPARDQNDHRLRLRKIQRPSDGWEWSQNFD
jgi:hypothetical protein